MRSGARSSFTPSACSTSALPQWLETERLPCLATATPAPATTNAAVVEMLKVPARSPPVPQVSMRGWRVGRTGVTWRRMARANPMISAMVSPLARSAAR